MPDPTPISRPTTREVTVTYLGNLGPAGASQLTIPAGTMAVRVADPGGGWAVADTALVIRLSGSAHDPQYRYCWLPPEAFDPPA